MRNTVFFLITMFLLMRCPLAVASTALSQENVAWTRFLECRIFLTDAQLKTSAPKTKLNPFLDCLKATLPKDANQVERTKATEFLLLRLTPPALEDCPADVRSRHSTADLAKQRYACFVFKLNGPQLAGEIEFTPVANSKTELRVRKIRYGF